MKIIIIIFVLLILLIPLSCHKKDDNGFYIFKIKKGNHRSTNRISFRKSNSISFSFIFDDSCKYDLGNTEDRYDVNKLFGISDGRNHMDNSARIGWRYLDGQLEIFGYIHNDKKFYFEKICNVELNKEYKCNISIESDKYVFIVDGQILHMDRKIGLKNKTKYLLYPYFGGNQSAPHDMIIKIKY